MKNECKIVQDMLPLYIENMVSEETADFVKEHLDGCTQCTSEFESMKSGKEIEHNIQHTESITEDEIVKVMKSVRKKISRKAYCIAGVIVATVFLLVGIIWRVLPHSFADVIPVNTNMVSNFACMGNVSGVRDGEPYIDLYSLSNATSEEEHFLEIIEIMNSTNYRQDFRNLLPWAITDVGADDSFCSVTLMLIWGSTPEESCTISYLDNNLIGVSFGGSDGYEIYHPTDHSVLTTLIEYLQLHGNAA